MSSLWSMRLVLTFDGDEDGLLDEELRLDEHAADVGTLVHPLLDITQLQGSILKHHLHKHSILTTRPNKVRLLFLQIKQRYFSIGLSHPPATSRFTSFTFIC